MHFIWGFQWSAFMGNAVAHGFLTNAGVGELAVPTPKEYVERAVALASDWDLLDVLHKNLRTMLENSPAMDAEGYVREIEGKYKEILSAVHNHDVFD